MSLLHPYLRRNIQQAIDKARKAPDKATLALWVREAEQMIRQEQNRSSKTVAAAMQKAVGEHKELLALLGRLNTVTADKIESLK